MRTRYLAVLACLISFVSHAAGLAVSPILVTLDDTDRTALVKVSNGDTVPHSYQLEMKAWSESRSGQMELGPTKDVIFFPQILSLAPGASRNVRVGVMGAPSAVERSYRLFIQEMPRVRGPGEKAAVQVLTRVGIPVFVAPTGAQPHLELSALKVVDGSLQLTVKNTGNSHLRPDTVSVSLLDGQGSQLFRKTWNGWYILAHGERIYSAKVPSEKCKKGTSLHAEVFVESKPLVSGTVPADSKSCGQ